MKYIPVFITDPYVSNYVIVMVDTGITIRFDPSFVTTNEKLGQVFGFDTPYYTSFFSLFSWLQNNNLTMLDYFNNAAVRATYGAS